MEALLTLSFDNISSRDTSRIRKGLRQIEGLLAQICVAPTTLSPRKRASHIRTGSDNKEADCKSLLQLRKDAAFREFFRLQEGFQWNVASRLVTALERLMGMHNDAQIDLAILSTLDLLQGILLLHPPSRCLFAGEDDMNLVLDLLDYANPPEIQCQALLVLVTALLDCPRNTRVFEEVDGLLTVTSLFKNRGATKEVKMRTLEFLYFYLMPEVPATLANSLPITALGSGVPYESGPAHARTHSGDMSVSADKDMPIDHLKTVSQKQKFLGRYLDNVAELVRDLHEHPMFSAPDGQ